MSQKLFGPSTGIWRATETAQVAVGPSSTTEGGPSQLQLPRYANVGTLVRFVAECGLSSKASGPGTLTLALYAQGDPITLGTGALVSIAATPAVGTTIKSMRIEAWARIVTTTSGATLGTVVGGLHAAAYNEQAGVNDFLAQAIQETAQNLDTNALMDFRVTGKFATSDANNILNFDYVEWTIMTP